MAEIRPFRGLRYDPARAGRLDTLIAPPYDVISPAQQEALYAASPYNIVRIELSREEGEARYASAAALLAQWRQDGILVPEARPALYLYEQRFTLDGQTYRRRAIIARVRLEPFESGAIRPHEYTLSGPKEDRLRLLEATRTQVSPVYALYRADRDDPLRGITMPSSVVSATDLAGEEHRLAPIDDPEAHAAVAHYLRERPLYIADGHHRYETALRYRDQRRAAATTWTGDEPENFVMMALTPHDDLGLVILPIHRLVHRPLPPGTPERLQRFFHLTLLPWNDEADEAAALERLRAYAAARPAFIAAGVYPGRLLLVTLRDAAAVAALMPAERSAAWRALAVNVLQYGVLQAALGIDLDAIAAGGVVSFTENAREALAEVRSGRAAAAFLLNPTRVEEVFAVADAGDRMPQKSTFFYPKLGTGLVLNAFDLDGAG